MGSKGVMHAISSPDAPIPSHARRMGRFWGRLWYFLPQGHELPYLNWRLRHRGILVLLALHAVALPLFGLYMGVQWSHSLLEGGVVALLALAASWNRLHRRVQSSIACLGLITCSAILTHLSGGYIEAHFHFFVMLGVIALYQDWIPFLLSIAYVALHHGTIGMIDPGSVYNHPAAFAQPWKWALIHAVFVLGLSAANLVTWRAHEEARAQTRRVLDAAGEGILGLDSRGRVSFANPAAEKMTAHPISDLVGRALPDLLTIETNGNGAPAQAGFQAATASRGSGILHQNGQLGTTNGTPAGPAPTARDGVAVEWVYSPIHRGAEYLGAVVTLRDVTERHKAEALIRHKHKQLVQVQQITSLGSWEWIPGTTKIDCSDEFHHIFGRDPAAGPMTLQHVTDAIVPEDQPRWKARLDRALETARAAFRTTGARETPLAAILYRITRPDGAVRAIHGQGVVEVDERGEPVRLFGATQDVTERMHVEVELRSALSLLSATLESTEDGILVVDQQGRIASFNQRFARMWRLPEDILGTRDDDKAIAFVLDQLKEPEVFVKKVRELYDNPDAVSSDVLEFKDGRVFERYSQPQRIGGACVGRVWSFRDVTERRQAEAERLRSAARVRELERLKDLDRLKSEFLNTAAHELRTPLTPIKIQLHLLKNGIGETLSEEQRRSVDIVDRNVDRLALLIQDELETTRLHAGRLQLKKTVQPLDRLLREAMDSFRDPAAQAGVILDAQLENDVAVDVDDKRIIQVVYNLFSNALKFTPKEGHILAELRRDGQTALVCVRDSGIGMDAEQLSRLFQPFSQVHDETESQPKGSGLGLYISKGIVELHGGTIWAESAGRNHGTAFYVALPMAGSAPGRAEDRQVTVFVDAPQRARANGSQTPP